MIHASCKRELLDALAESVDVEDRFCELIPNGGSPHPIFVGSEPIRSKEKALCNGVGYVDEKGVITGLDVFEEAYLKWMITRGTDYRIVTGGLAQQTIASRLSVTEGYKNNVLSKYFVHTGDVVVAVGGAHMAVDLGEPKPGSMSAMESLAASDFKSESARLNFLSMQDWHFYDVPGRNGYYRDFSRRLPLHSDLGERSGGSLGYFSSVLFDKSGVSSITSSWGECVGMLFSSGVRTGESFYNSAAMGFWIHGNPRK